MEFLVVALTAFFLIMPVELPDKTFVATLVLGLPSGVWVDLGSAQRVPVHAHALDLVDSEVYAELCGRLCAASTRVLRLIHILRHWLWRFIARC